MECNPFHNGHEYILTAAKEQFGADHIVVVMSGDHVQRGEPAIVDKYLRTASVLRAGADLVLELPVPFATGSAQYFARGAVSALLHTGVVDTLLFGSECGEISVLREVSQAGSPVISNTKESNDNSSRDTLHTGNHIPMSHRLSPNDLLAVEYLKALEHFNSGLSALTLPRQGSSYHETELKDRYTSASALRKHFFSDPVLWPEAAACMPAVSYQDMTSYAEQHHFLSWDAYSDLLYYALRKNKASGYDRYFDVYEDFSQKIASRLGEYKNAISFIASLKSKDITYSHISRALLHILLGITKEQVNTLTSEYEYCPYLRTLGLRKGASDLLHAIKANSDRPLLSKLADARTLLSGEVFSLLEQDIFASELYAKIASKNGGTVSEYRRGLVIL